MKPTKKSALAFAMFAIACVATTSPAFAQKKKTAEQKLLEQGEAKYKAGDYAAALGDFQAAADASHWSAQSARYVGLCEDKLGHYANAVTAYERFLSEAPAKLRDEVAETKKRVDEIKAMPAHLHATSNPAGATVTVDGASTPARQTPVDFDVPPGKHTVHFALQGRKDQDRDIDVAYGAKLEVHADLDPAAAAGAAAVAPAPGTTPGTAPGGGAAAAGGAAGGAPTAPGAAAPGGAPGPGAANGGPAGTPATQPATPPPAPRSLTAAYVSAGLAVASAGVGTLFGVLALKDKSDFKNNPTTSTADAGEAHALLADMGFGLALTFGVTSLVMFLSNGDEDSGSAPQPTSGSAKSPRFRLHPVATGIGSGGALLRF